MEKKLSLEAERGIPHFVRSAMIDTIAENVQNEDCA
jgi:hypothetical protein